MKLETLAYSQYENEPQAWKIVNCSFGDINLIVGKNAIGKTRTLHVIETLANLLTGRAKLKGLDGNFDVRFSHNGQSIVYTLRTKPDKFICESLKINSTVQIDRGSEGAGKIFAEELGKHLQFQIDTNEVAAFARRDLIQHPFLEDLYKWGKSLLRYNFGTPLGKTHLAVNRANNENLADPDLLKDTDKVIEIFMRGREAYSNDFVEVIIEDMAKIDYKLDHIEAKSLSLMKSMPLPMPFAFMELVLKESALPGETRQTEMSQGMFRALSILIQINYASFSSSPSCILIDDIGEGLDFNRASSLVKLIIEKAKKFSMQLIMATNDRFIMNNVPLEYWIVLGREGSQSIHYNYRNSKDIFDKFELTGLSNFDFFTTDYYLQGQHST